MKTLKTCEPTDSAQFNGRVKWQSVLGLWPFVLVTISVVGLAYEFLSR
jgi:hypothetical protein